MRVEIGAALAPPGDSQIPYQNTADPQTADAAPEKAYPPPVFISPVVHIDLSGLPVTLFRDIDSGEVEFQIPSEEAVTKYREAEVGGRKAERMKRDVIVAPETDAVTAKRKQVNNQAQENDKQPDKAA